MSIHSRLSLEASNGATNQSTGLLIQNPYIGNSNQQFLFQKLENHNFIIKANHSKKCLVVLGGSKNEGINITQESCKSKELSQQWIIKVVGH